MPSQPQLWFGDSAAMRKVLLAVACFAPTSDPILILGERGSGKTSLAGRIHQLSRRQGAFVEQSAPVVPKDMEAAYLTGHVRGAFTGAYEERVGLLESAHRGTFFLDEVGLASDQLQRILLRLLEAPAIRRLGETRERRLDVRLIVATNEDLGELVAAGAFRADLNDRLGSMIVRVPSLAERRDEILPRAGQFLAEMADTLGLAQEPTIAQPVRELFLAAAWPGNLRQLRSVCRAALALAYHGRDATEIDLEDLPLEFVAPLGDIGRVRCTKARDRRSRLREALEQAKGNKSEAARLLGISRQTLYRLLDTGTAGALAAVCTMGPDMLQVLL